MTAALVLGGERPEKPIFDTTRGYTKDLWELTTRCWEGTPGDRPTVGHVLDTLRSAAEQWEPENGEIDTPPPSPLTDESD